MHRPPLRMHARREREGERRTLSGSARDFAWLYSPAPLRAVLGPLLDIEREIGAALRGGLDHGVAHVRLAWWREECSRCAAGRPVHPATRALLAAAGHRAIDPVGLVEVAEWDLAAATFQTRADLVAYCDRWASAMTVIVAQESSGAALARAFGAALKEIELLNALAADAHLGRLRLPLDELEAHGIEPSALARPPWPPALRSLIEARHRAGRASLAASCIALPATAQPAQRGLLVWSALTVRGSSRAVRAARQGGAPAASSEAGGRAARLGDAWHAWRAARLADRRRFRIKQEERT